MAKQSKKIKWVRKPTAGGPLSRPCEEETGGIIGGTLDVWPKRKPSGGPTLR